ncbi:MAG: FIST C-terminal domain-containing protein [Candidatus Omnitrophica bacterium]|nr:FIST C-terminal domain-containing protein [Candidatus Omnitrophota bacterium]
MKTIQRLSTDLDVERIIKQLTHDVSGTFNLGFLFVSSFSKSKTAEIFAALKNKIDVVNILSCSCAGVLSIDIEIELKPACSLILMQFDDVRITPFYFTQSQIEDFTEEDDWYNALNVYPNESPKFIAMPNPFSIDMSLFVEGINEAYPDCPVVGGLISGDTRSRENSLHLNDTQYDEGMIGVILTGNINMHTIVSQGCRPFGKNYIVTKADGNIIYELAGQPLYEILQKELEQASMKDKILAQEAIFLGVAMDEYIHKLRRGDFLIRMLLGIDENIGAGAVADYIEQGQTVQFHVRDAISATEDLHIMLEKQKQNYSQLKPEAILAFSCTGRGENFFREKNHDVDIIKKYMGNVPLSGFFSAGEIGPVGGENFIHSFTISLALFYSPEGYDK